MTNNWFEIILDNNLLITLGSTTLRELSARGVALEIVEDTPFILCNMGDKSFSVSISRSIAKHECIDDLLDEKVVFVSIIKDFVGDFVISYQNIGLDTLNEAVLRAKFSNLTLSAHSEGGTEIKIRNNDNVVVILYDKSGKLELFMIEVEKGKDKKRVVSLFIFILILALSTLWICNLLVIYG